MTIQLIRRVRAYSVRLLKLRYYMESKIPLPTDSIYKFLAMFSLLLVIFSVGAVIYASNSTNAVGFEHWVELEVLQAVEEPR